MEGAAFKTIRVEGPQGELRVHVRGSQGTAVLLVHGNGGRGSQWEPQLKGLGAGQVAALDLRGMGASAPPRNGDFSMGGFAADVVAVANALGYSRLVLVGHSLGGSVVACCAALCPERVLGVVLVDLGGDPRNASRAELAALCDGLAPEAFAAFSRQALATCLKGARPEVKAQVLTELRATPRATFAGAILGMLDFDAGAALANPWLNKRFAPSDCQRVGPGRRPARAPAPILLLHPTTGRPAEAADRRADGSDREML